jgi:drug/metabolite transporter (DMT)-like permease
MSAVFLGVVAAFCWSLHDLIVRRLALGIGPFRMAALVIVAGGLWLMGPVLWTGTIWQASPRGLIQALLLGLAYGLGASGLFKAFSLGPVSIVAPLTAAYPVLVVFWGVINGLVPSGLQWVAIAATLAGAMAVARTGHRDGGFNAVAPQSRASFLFFCLLACLGYATAVVLGQSAAVMIGETEAALVSRPTALLAILPFLRSELRTGPLKPLHWLAILVMGGLDMLGLVAVNAAGFLPGKEFAAVGISAYGAIAVILAMLTLREKVSAGQWGGIALITAGVAGLAAP